MLLSLFVSSATYNLKQEQQFFSLISDKELCTIRQPGLYRVIFQFIFLLIILQVIFQFRVAPFILFVYVPFVKLPNMFHYLLCDITICAFLVSLCTKLDRWHLCFCNDSWKSARRYYCCNLGCNDAARRGRFVFCFEPV